MKAIARGDAASLEQAVSLYRGPLLESCAEPWAFEERQSREQAYLGAVETLAAHARAAGDRAAAERHLRRAVTVDPLRETAHRALMETLAAGGNYGAALLTYRELRLLLHREIHVEPDPATTALFHALRQHAREAGNASSRKCERSESRTGKLSAETSFAFSAVSRLRDRDLEVAPETNALRHNLPLQLTRFIGRETQMTEVRRLLEGGRLVTLTGAGGCGKSRLALEVAGGLVEPFRDGVWLVELASLADPALVPQRVAATLDVQEQPDRSLVATLVHALKTRELVLVLDNCEHLVETCAELVAALLQSCAGLRVLATSREALGVAGELPYRVPSLSLPEAGRLPPLERLVGYEAVRLFTDRAAALLPTFQVTEENAATVAAICQRLDGIPLAIELAAAHVRALPVEKLAERLDDRFRLLTGGRRAAPPRHQTLQASIDWSYNLLSEGERALLRRLSVFAGGWTLEAAEAVCAGESIEALEVLGLLTQLLDKSLVVYEEPGTYEYRGASEGRYRLLETVRQYGCDRLVEIGEAAAVRERHLAFFLHLAEEANPELWGGHALGEEADRRHLDLLDREHGNLLAALDQCQAVETRAAERDRTQMGLRFAAALGPFWEGKGYWSEGRERLARALSQAGTEPTTARADALYQAGELAVWQADYATARSLFTESLVVWQRSGNRPHIGRVLNELGIVARDQGDYETARHLFEQALAINREIGYRRPQAGDLQSLGTLSMAVGDYSRARILFEEALAIDRELGVRGGAAFCSLGWVAAKQGDLAGARRIFEEDLRVQRELKDRQGVANALAFLGQVALEAGDTDAARSFYHESLTIHRELGNRRHLNYSLWSVAVLAAARGASERSARLLGAVDALRDVTGIRLEPGQVIEWERDVTAAREALGEEAFAAAWAAGRAMTLEEATCVALAECEIPA
jgi:predicted ATPase/Tfp pilus assembly protein PilF